MNQRCPIHSFAIKRFLTYLGADPIMIAGLPRLIEILPMISIWNRGWHCLELISYMSIVSFANFLSINR